MNDRFQYTSLANLFRYPKEGYQEQVNDCAKILSEDYPEAFKEMKPFLDIINKKDIHEIEEIFGRTFHIQAICYLDLGYVLYAEDYKRGDFLVHMKDEQRKVGNDCGEELADNLPNVLQLLSMIPDKEFLQELTVKMIIPALKKMLEEFDLSRIELKTKIMKKKQKVIIQENLEHKNIYQFAIQTVLSVLEKDFEGIKYEGGAVVKPDTLSSFLPSCGTCSDDHSPKKDKEKAEVKK